MEWRPFGKSLLWLLGWGPTGPGWAREPRERSRGEAALDGARAVPGGWTEGGAVHRGLSSS